MSFKAVFQFILLIHDFKNVDLPNQGLAAISASIYKQQKNKQSTYAIPYEYPYQRNYKLTKKKIKQDSSIEDSFFLSKVVMIKYSDQLVNIDDFVQFRMELQGFPYLNTDNVFLELNLIFSNRYYSSDEDRFDGKPVSQVKMKLKDIQNGIFCYYQADFKQEYFSKCSFTLYGQLMYYKFQKYEIKPKQQSSRQISRSKIANFGNLLIWSNDNYLQADEDPFQLFYSNYVKNLRHSNYLIQTKLNEFLLIKRKLQMKVSSKFLQSCGLEVGQTQIDQKLFREYLQSYKQPLSLDDIPQEIQQIRIENFQFLKLVIEQMFHGQFDVEKMKHEYSSYIKEKFGERVFKNTLYRQDLNLENALKQNKKIAKQMRNKKFELTEYPIQDQAFLNNRDDHEFVFYELTLPQYLKQGFKEAIKQRMHNESEGHMHNGQQADQATLLGLKGQQENKKSSTVSLNTQNSTSINSQQHPQLNQYQNPSVDQEQSSNNTQKSDTYENSQQFFTQSDIAFERLQYSQKNMLVVMCHGFQGSSYDMLMIQKGIKAQLPEASYLLSRKNEDDTEGDIQKMGQRLADQIKYYIRAFMAEESVIINFVGHSMGGIIARASFKHLVKYKEQFGFYCSLSSPHLGYLNGVDNKIKAGLWVLRKWKPIKSLDQLSMEQAKDQRKTFLYRLSKMGTLKFFRKIIFFSSFEDSYVSWHSARVSQHTSHNSQSRIQNQMVQNILGLEHGKNIDTTLHRLDVNFNVKGNNIDSLIGRAAHINLIIQDSLFDVINVTLPNLFNLKEYGTGLIQPKESIVGSQKVAKKHSQSNKKARSKEGTLTRPSLIIL